MEALELTPPGACRAAGRRLATSAVRRLCIFEIKGFWAVMLVADDVTPPESGKMTTIYARMAREDEACLAKALMKAFRNSQPSVPVYRDIRVSRARTRTTFAPIKGPG